MSTNISVQDFDLFKHAFTEENLELQIIIVQKLESLAKALGEKATREDLLPFIQLHYTELHDELLLNLAIQLRSFIPLVGGVKHAQIIFDLLGKLCITDENVVREKAVETLIYIQQNLDTLQTEEFLLPIIKALIKDDWFTSKCSAVMLLSTIYPKLTKEKKAALRNTLKHLIQDDSPMVRKATATACINFVKVAEDDFLRSEFIPIFRDIAQDPMDSVRSIVIDIALALIKRLGQDGLDESIFKTIESASDDPSWRLRQRLANSLASLQQEIPHGKYRGKLIALLQKLTYDLEAEVRVLTASNLFAYCKYLKDSYFGELQKDNNFEPVFEQSIMPVIQRLALDENEDVRLALSTNILPLSIILSDECFKNNIVSFLLQVLNREGSIAIQTNFLLGLSSLPSNVDMGQSLQAIKNAVKSVIERSQANWRTRRSVLLTFIDIAKFCNADYFNENFNFYYAALLRDPIFAVRRTATLILPILAKHYGIKWASENLISDLITFAKDSRYLYRFVVLFGIRELVNPHICTESNLLLLSDFKKFLPDTRKALLSLAKINKINELILKELKEQKCLSILKLKEELNYHETSWDIKMYAEKEFDLQIAMYSIEEKDFIEKDRWPYLQGVLTLIYHKFLPIIEMLNKDITQNVQIKAISTLGEIEKFVGKINEELSQEWVQNFLKLVTREEILKIDEEIYDEFKNEKNNEEQIDTRLTEEVDLSKTISIENSNIIGEKVEGNKNNPTENNDAEKK